jgi:ADP-heptose:LPS heptosyltransferase
MTEPERILVIRLGALGDIILCFQAFHEIRSTYPTAKISLLTMPAFVDFARRMPWFDDVIVDDRPSMWQWRHWAGLIARLRAFDPTFVYDLQGKFRQNILYVLLGGPWGTNWSGSAPYCSHPRLWPPSAGMHFTDFIAAQLRRAGVPPQSQVDLAWLGAPVEAVHLPERYAVLITGCTPGRPYKRWPAKNYAAIARWYQRRGIASVAVGTKVDTDSVAAVKEAYPDLIDFTGRTNLDQLATVIRGSQCVVGNDTGPTHLAAALGAKTLALMPDQVQLTWAAPYGPSVWTLRGNPLNSLSVDEVLLALERILDKNV